MKIPTKMAEVSTVTRRMVPRTMPMVRPTRRPFPDFFPVLALCSVFFGWLSLFIDRAPSFLCYWCMRRTDRGMDEKTFYSIIKTIVPYLSTAEKCHFDKNMYLTER